MSGEGAQAAISANCEVAGMLAGRLGAPASVPELLTFLTDRWDGKGRSAALLGSKSRW